MQGKKEAVWRQLAVEVTAEQVQASWEGKALKALSRAALGKLGESNILGDFELGDYEFAPQGALGLYAYKSKASFRNVVIESFK